MMRLNASKKSIISSRPILSTKLFLSVYVNKRLLILYLYVQLHDQLHWYKNKHVYTQHFVCLTSGFFFFSFYDGQ